MNCIILYRDIEPGFLSPGIKNQNILNDYLLYFWAESFQLRNLRMFFYPRDGFLSPGIKNHLVMNLYMQFPYRRYA